MPNFTDVTEFVLLGLTSHQELQVLFFVVFLVVYMITLIGNIGMIILISISFQLQSSMYFFLSHLSFVDVWFSSKVTLKMLENLLSGTKTISYVGCLVQCYFFTGLVHVEVCILAVMAFDRYMAICSPLLYGSEMSRTVCARLISVTYIYGFSVSLICTLWTYGLCFCGNFEINHFYCADRALIKIACGGVHSKECTMIVIAGMNFTYSLSVVLMSYTLIIAAVLRMRSADGRRKAFSACGSHLTAVAVFYGALLFMYLRRPTEESVERGKMVAVFYPTVIPMLSPMIYSLRNEDVKEAVNKANVKASLRQ
ncbi:olfactory receptor 5M9-like [Bubalus kerabau]|uniref:olfactory receptor 5M9-like n=1 Tax=Bubalus carabanensis TaxID=3119969 RepID=UPI001D10D1CC|nr:olfactory receptor 5M9-like [Bubalus carabanensis]XP_055399078.1 olfactory receptor 5M9-like [Bubalus carabanensis]XP_055399079.1 olfactory receptor 5M9-like [Bubalus carabanensis]XP_055399080.1 olfactory receptor 5M9-like [Bubalus carabanensis]XP_055399081.1 olfactory receptor 5M9-like [Bubalus carabanensis]